MVCTRCHNQCKDGEQFCHVCGNKLSISAPVGEETTLLEGSNDVREETTLLDEFEETAPQPTQPQRNAPDYSSRNSYSAPSAPDNIQQPSYDSYSMSGKKKINTETIVVAAIAVVVIAVIVVLFVKG